MANIFTISTATHLLQIEEARHQLSCEADDNYLIVFGHYRDCYDQLHGKVDPSSWTEVYYFYSFLYFLFDDRGIPKRYTRIYKRCLYMFAYGRLLRRIKKWGAIKKLFTVNILSNDIYLRRLMNEADFERMVLFDDGSSTITLADKIDQQVSEGNNPVVINEVRLPEAVTFFSSYRIKLHRPGDQLIINQFNLQQRKIKNLDNFGEKVYFLGAPLGRIYMKPDVYLTVLRRVSKYFKGHDVYYIPHRTENKAEIDEVEKIFKILTIDAPAEKILMDGQVERPAILASCFSSGLVNVSAIFSSTERLKVKAFYLNSEDLLVHHDRIRKIYRSFEMLDHNRIEVVKDY
ncbi:hypothetical protein AWW67_11225 [Roseivirga seohaensis]|uniref:Glycosyltransferase family 52 n=1 Tax=Roseivirga seohaensis TaxID=1914963 RepID=A0A150XME2_9BACT|nr:hypothetical protein [Roseivirga seohaensis]KYG79874.1 hypothetical protein AWW67_11225 [Roseivirga seohaensis]